MLWEETEVPEPEEPPASDQPPDIDETPFSAPDIDIGKRGGVEGEQEILGDGMETRNDD
jgi:hypothetical protein